jgi:hypothetical protein
MTNRMRIALFVTTAAIASVCVWFLFRPPPKVDSVAGLARYYGVSEETIQNVARAYKVPPEEIGSYGELPFPVNYIQHVLGWAWDQPEHPTIYRSEIEALVTGYVSRCDLEDTITLYLFYSDWLRPKTWSHGEALPMKIVYELDVSQKGIRDDQVVQDITYYDLGDSGGWPWEQVAPVCVPPGRY